MPEYQSLAICLVFDAVILCIAAYLLDKTLSTLLGLCLLTVLASRGTLSLLFGGMVVAPVSWSLQPSSITWAPFCASACPWSPASWPSRRPVSGS